MRRALLLAAVLLLALPGVAVAQIDAAADALRSDSVYVDPSAELADQVDAAALRAQIGDAPVYVAVLPESALQGSAGRTLIALREAVGKDGTYALAVGDEFRTLSDADGFDAAGAGDDARAANPDDLQAALAAFIGSAPRESTNGSESGGGGAGVFAAFVAVVVLLAIAVGGVMLLTTRRRQRRDREVHEEFVRENLDEDFVRLGDAIRHLELDVTLTTSDASARADYDRAVEAYDRANDLNRREQPEAANRALDEGLQAISRARERLAGRLKNP